MPFVSHKLYFCMMLRTYAVMLLTSHFSDFFGFFFYQKFIPWACLLHFFLAITSLCVFLYLVSLGFSNNWHLFLYFSTILYYTVITFVISFFRPFTTRKKLWFPVGLGLPNALCPNMFPLLTLFLITPCTFALYNWSPQ